MPWRWFFSLLPAAVTIAAEPAVPAIRWDTANPAAIAVEITGLAEPALRAAAAMTNSPAEAARVLALFAVPAEAAADRNLPPMTGTWRVAGNRLRFEPQFPLSRGVRYRAEFRPAPWAGGAEPMVSFFELPADRAPPTTVVTEIFPSAPTLPENQLKFYVQFSAPMSGGASYRHIHVRDAEGRDIDLPFLELDEELWNPAMTRLTLLIDPGRIKRGVKPLVDIGPVFEEGKLYALTIDPDWHDANGRPLRTGFRKEIRIGPADRTPPDPARWKLTPPAAGTRQPLVVMFDESMDQALALRMIAVAAAAGEGVNGEPALSERERRWTFTPAAAWSRGKYQLMVSSTIEDLAGNNIGKVFDVDVFESVQRKIETPSVKVGFEVK